MSQYSSTATDQDTRPTFPGGFVAITVNHAVASQAKASTGKPLFKARTEEELSKIAENTPLFTCRDIPESISMFSNNQLRGPDVFGSVSGLGTDNDTDLDQACDDVENSISFLGLAHTASNMRQGFAASIAGVHKMVNNGLKEIEAGSVLRAHVPRFDSEHNIKDTRPVNNGTVDMLRLAPVDYNTASEFAQSIGRYVKADNKCNDAKNFIASSVTVSSAKPEKSGMKTVAKVVSASLLSFAKYVAAKVTSNNNVDEALLIDAVQRMVKSETEDVKADSTTYYTQADHDFLEMAFTRMLAAVYYAFARDQRLTIGKALDSTCSGGSLRVILRPT